MLKKKEKKKEKKRKTVQYDSPTKLCICKLDKELLYLS